MKTYVAVSVETLKHLNELYDAAKAVVDCHNDDYSLKRHLQGVLSTVGNRFPLRADSKASGVLPMVPYEGPIPQNWMPDCVRIPREGDNYLMMTADKRPMVSGFGSGVAYTSPVLILRRELFRLHKGMRYYYLVFDSLAFTVDESIEKLEAIDEEHFRSGNYFINRDRALKAAEDMNKKLKDAHYEESK